MPGLAGRLMNPIDLEDLRGVLCVLVRVVLSWDLLAVCTGIGHFDPKSIFLGEIVILPENKSDFMRERWLRFRCPPEVSVKQQQLHSNSNGVTRQFSDVMLAHPLVERHVRRSRRSLRHLRAQTLPSQLSAAGNGQLLHPAAEESSQLQSTNTAAAGMERMTSASTAARAAAFRAKRTHSAIETDL